MNRLFVLGLLIALVGFFVMAVAPLLQVSSAPQATTAGCILIFFVPICFGAGQPQTVGAAVLASAVILAALFVISLLLFLWPVVREQKQDQH
ncbi:MAG: hypothetical protein ABWJ97_04335 [Thermoproteus sp.]